MQNARLFEIVYILLESGSITAAKLAERFEVSVRTIYRDIDALSQAGVPVYAERGKGGGIRMMEGFSIEKSLLSESERTEVLSALQGFTSIIGRGEALGKLSAFFGIESESWLDVDLSNWCGSDEDVFKLIRGAITGRYVLSFDYYNPSGEVSSRSILPTKLRFKSKTWYCQGFCLERKAMRIFKISRMKRVSVTDKHYEIGNIPAEDPIENFGRDQECTKIILKIRSEMAFRIYDDFDETEITRLPDGDFVVTVSYPVDGWVYGLILSYGNNAEVIEPQFMRDELKRIAESIKNKYHTNPKS
ncbi:MAG: YafY family transcriptional regulator [Oscillospiraceae bacterium]|nr:YafY family transcriptional regulator [Oscillospiraceae bacterium]